MGGDGKPGLSRYVGDPQIREWNPIALWIAIHGGCDPLGAKQPIDQVTVGLAINELAECITDDAARKSIKSTAAGVVAKSAQSVLAKGQL